MIYKFITDQDLDVGMKLYFRNQIIETNTHILTTSEGAAFSLIKSKLNGRYDMVKLFPETKPWDTTRAYLKGEYCFQSDMVFKALQDTTGNDPDTTTTYWESNDPRDQLLVVYCVRITIYFLCQSLNPRKVPEDIINDYMDAMEWLDACQKGMESPDWPILENGSSTINWGSNEKLDHYY